MSNRSELVQQLRNSIGTEVEYNGLRCTVVELLEEPLSLVIQATSAHTTIQDNQFGDAQRRVAQVFTLPCLSDTDDGALHQELLSLELGLK
jgi:hypothetical protein